MERLWSPWRSKYVLSFKKPARRTRSKKSLFAAALASGDDDRHMIVWRGRLCFVIMNRYPYNSGHLMVVPNRQTADIGDLTADELADIMQTVQRSIRALEDVMHPQGYNFGANLGKVGGAGVHNHVHFHIVPRWTGDTNFMPVLSDTKVISEDMRDTLRKLRKSFKKHPF